jgi:hypothetical protein
LVDTYNLTRLTFRGLVELHRFDLLVCDWDRRHLRTDTKMW